MKESWWKPFIVWAGIIALVFVVVRMFDREGPVKQVSYTDFLALVDKAGTEEGLIGNIDVQGDPLRGDEYVAKTKNEVVTTFAPFDETLRKELREKVDLQNQKFRESPAQLSNSQEPNKNANLLKITYKRSDDGQAWHGKLTY